MQRGGAGLQIMDFLQHFPFLCEALLQVTFLIMEGDLNNIPRNSPDDSDMSTLKVLNAYILADKKGLQVRISRL